MKRVLIVIVGALVLASQASAKALPNPCTLVSNAEAARVLGTKVADRIPDKHECRWEGVSQGVLGYHAELTLDIARITRNVFEKAAKKTQDAVRVHGIGDAAFSMYMDSGSGYLAVWSRGTWFSVSFTGRTDSQPRVNRLARLVVPRL